MNEKIRVSIIGWVLSTTPQSNADNLHASRGGLAGCALFNGLLESSHLEVDMFESKAIFRKRGIGVSLHPNGQNALRQLGLDLDSVLSNAGAVLEPGIECVVVSSQIYL